MAIIIDVLTGRYFADSFADCLQIYGAKVTQLKAPIGARPSLADVEEALRGKNYKLITITHVDTSTGVLSDVRGIAAVVQKVSPDTLIIVDGVCSVGCEEIDFSAWGIDIVLTASQKALGVPPGLSLLLASPRAMNVFHEREGPETSYFASWKRWLPIMQAYESRKPMYFATPPVQLIYALNTSLKQILSRPLTDRFAAHLKASKLVKDYVENLGLKTLPNSRAESANGMTAVWVPEGVKLPDLLPKIASKQVVFAGGLHKEIASIVYFKQMTNKPAKYFRIGHMGVSVTESGRDDLQKALEALKTGLSEVGWSSH